MKYPIAPNGIFTTIQGEGSRAGEPMIFLRLAGCSVGCPLCDTDYSVSRRLDPSEIAADVAIQRQKTYTNSLWITGGEPMDHDLMPLAERLRGDGFNLCLATSGQIEVPDRMLYWLGVWLSVSPHDPAKWVQRTGNELKIVPGLNGFSLADFVKAMEEKATGFGSKFACPCEGRPETVAECRDFVVANRGWRMGGQLHKLWKLP